LGSGAARSAVLGQAALEDADHGAENGFKGPAGRPAAAGNVGRQGDHGAGILDVFKMLAGEIRADDLGADVAGGEVHFHAFPATLPVWVGEEASENFGVEIALAAEIAVEAAVGEAGAGHDLLDGDAFKTVAIEEPARAVNYGFLDLGAVSNGIRHKAPL